MRRIIEKGWLALLIVLLLTACSKEDEVVSADNPTDIEEVPDVEEQIEEPVLPYISPFTGVRSEEEFTHRPVLVTINNHPHARPQSGISDADMIYELLAEGQVTRLLGLFQSNLPEEIGPVRSARDYFINIAKGLDAFYIAHGYSPEAKQMLENRVVDNLNGMQYDGILFWRSKERVAPHNSYISAENIKIGAEKVNAELGMTKEYPFSFYDSAEDVTIGTMATTIDVRYGQGESFHHIYTYDAANAVYERQSNKEQTIDKANGEVVKIANILFLEADHRTIDSVGRQAIDLASGGKAYLFQAGVMKEIEWENKEGILVPIENGEIAKLVPGKTWIHVVQTKPGISSSVTFTP